MDYESTAPTGCATAPSGSRLGHRRGRVGSGLGLVEAEPDLHRDLEVADLAVLKVAADVGDLEPVEVAQGGARSGDAVAHRLVDRVRGGSHDLGDPVDVVGHHGLLDTVHTWTGVSLPRPRLAGDLGRGAFRHGTRADRA